jgi:hypothetical protein
MAPLATSSFSAAAAAGIDFSLSKSMLINGDGIRLESWRTLRVRGSPDSDCLQSISTKGQILQQQDVAGALNRICGTLNCKAACQVVLDHRENVHRGMHWGLHFWRRWCTGGATVRSTYLSSALDDQQCSLPRHLVCHQYPLTTAKP